MFVLFVCVLVIAILNCVIGIIAYSNDYFDTSYGEDFSADKAITYILAGASIIVIRAYRNIRTVITTELEAKEEEEK